MSLKARLRLAVALLMSAMVAVLSGLYLRGFLDAAFSSTHETADSLANQMQAGILENLERQARQATHPPATAAEAVRFWRERASSDPTITGALNRAMRHWRLVSEVFITDDQELILASSAPQRTGLHAPLALKLAEWNKRSVLENLRQVYLGRQDAEVSRAIAIVGESTPVLTIHVVVSSLFLREELRSGMMGVAGMCAACLLASMILALVLPNVILSPLERLSKSLDRINTGDFSTGGESRGEAREFADVFKKLNTLQRQFQGARANVDELRGNVEQLLERLEEAVLLFDAAGRITMAGRAVRTLLDRDPTELTGLTADQVFPQQSGIGALIEKVLSNCSGVRDHACGIKSGDREFTILVSIQPVLRANSGTRLGALVTFRDAESRGEVAEQLEMANRMAAISHLTHGVAHEIKNPLNAIAVHLEVLRSRVDADLPELSIISTEIARLDRVVKTFLDFNRPVQPRLRALDLNDVAREVMRLVRPEAETRRVAATLVNAARPAMLCGDRDLLQQAVLNVVINAVEAMPSGGNLHIEVRRGGGRSELLVSDDGPGIPPEIQNKIFDLYFSTKRHGSGIGLAMTFRFVQLLDGRIEFSTEAGRGTTFRFSFPEAVSPARPETELSRSQQA
jgi:nitrogen-specific signal transduction histidine kinase